MAEQLEEFSKGAALVYGGSGGIGAEICRSLAASGSNVVLTYFSKSTAADEVVKEIEAMGRKAVAVQVNVEDPVAVKKAVDAALENFGEIHSVVYASGPPLEFLYINQISGAEWSRVINADVNGCFNVVEATLPHLRARGKGNYVGIITAAVDRAPPRDILSAAPKAAIQMLLRGVAREEGRNGIRANMVGPGYIEAGLGLATVHDHTKDFVERMMRAIPLKRPGRASDIADVTLFLLSDKSSYVTGVSIPVAGGLQLS
ncbi:SDR family oxidoreductase [Sphingobium sp. JS3065]|uniref:SDR family NAD(P)-dependent oxidoreductase n=1 Tax=Sphingobium sp. JS3065 TaxID=2970925 RepID=UPI002263E45A|nr:SDR family oxidoreductase [Sphingobium sp. JS3065]UZW57032.1 SDR family oxidoreductase [Sphingobium sp. JS3065]